MHAYLLKKSNKFAHEVTEDPPRQRVKGSSEWHTAHQEDDVCGSQVSCRRKQSLMRVSVYKAAYSILSYMGKNIQSIYYCVCVCV